jgi:hypothetical protein
MLLRRLALFSSRVLFFLLLAVAAVSDSRAELHAYEITGSIDGTSVSDQLGGSYFASGSIPFGTTVPYRLTFVLDDAAPLSLSGPDFSIYDAAVGDLALEIDGQPDTVVATTSSLTATTSSFFHTWSPGAFQGSPGYSASISSFDAEDGMSPPVTVDFIGFEAVLFDSTMGLYAASPPELVVADLSDATQTLMLLSWQDPSGNVRMGMSGTIDSITVPEPGLAAALATGLLGLGFAARGRARLHRAGAGSRDPARSRARVPSPAHDRDLFRSALSGRLALVLTMLLLAAPTALAAPGDELWQTGWGRSGANDAVYAATTFGTDLVIGGEFRTVGDAIARRVARFDGSSWSAMGEGFDGRVEGLVEWNGSLYAVGEFSNSGATPLMGLARWNGSAWEEVGGGTNGPAYDIVVYGGGLAIAGTFTSAGATSAAGVAIWNGTTWIDPGAEIGATWDGFVEALEVYGGQLYVAGRFEGIGPINANNIARWNGTTWSAVGTGVRWDDEGQEVGVVNDLTLHAGSLVAAGAFLEAGSVVADGIGIWNGTTWSAPGAASSGYDNLVFAVTSYGGALYASGSNFGLLQRWNGSFWTPVGFNANSAFVLANHAGLLVAGGYLGFGNFALSPNGTGATNVAFYDGTVWQQLASEWGASDDVEALHAWNGQLIAGGSFGRIGNVVASRLAAWNGTSWSALGGGTTGGSNYVTDMATWQGDLVIGGAFTHAGGVAAEKIARWNGSSWSALGAGSAGGVEAIHTIGAELYATGYWGGGSQSVGRWNGTNWDAVGGIVNTPGLSDLDDYQGQLVACGAFTTIGGVPANRIARFDGASWQPLGAGLDGTARAIEVVGDDLYVVGDFTLAGGASASRVARWNGTSWSALGGGLDNRVYDIEAIGTDLVVTGWFGNAAGTSAPYIARWDGNAWSSLGSGLGGRGGVLFAYEDSLFVGGEFETAGDKAGAGIAEWTPVPEPGTTLLLACGVLALVGRGRSAGVTRPSGARLRSL